MSYQFNNGCWLYKLPTPESWQLCNIVLEFQGHVIQREHMCLWEFPMKLNQLMMMKIVKKLF